MRREGSEVLLKGTFKGRNVSIVNVNGSRLNAWFKELPEVKVFINAASSSAIAKKKAMIIEDAKERFKRKVKVKGRIPVTRRNSKLDDGNRIEEITDEMELDLDREELRTQ
jgi:hypothetical protein